MILWQERIIIAQNQEILMAFCRTFLAILLFLNTVWSAEIPQSIQYQGRFLDAATNRPVAGVVTKQLNFNIRKVELGNIPGQIIFTHTANNVSIRDGIFNVEIPVPNNVNFDEPYGIEVIVQGSGGGNVGFQPFRSVPYAITAKNALQLGGISASLYSQQSHTHTTAGGKTFTIDGTGANLLGEDAQFKVINGDGQEVFRVTANGDLQRVNKIEATGAIETNASLRVVNQLQEDVFVADQDGNVMIAGDFDVSGNSTVSSLEVSGAATIGQVFVAKSLTFGPNAVISAKPSDNGPNIIGSSHFLEDHAVSDLFGKLESLTNGSLLTGALHSHSLGAGDITSESIADDSILARHIVDGTITNDDIAANAAIDDSKLATISTAGKITTEALPSEVAIKNTDNIFGAGFNPGSESTLATINSFDEIRSKTLSVISTSSGGGSQFIKIQDFNARFQWLLDGDGTLQFKRPVPSDPVGTRIEIKTVGDKTKILLQNVVFEGDGSMISGSVIEDGTIDSKDLASDSITTDKILDGAVTADKIADGAITEVKMASDSITTDKLKDGAITSSKIAPDAITTDKVADLSLTGAKIQNGAITGAKIQDNTITGAEIQNGKIGSNKIAPNAIQTNNIQDLALTGAKIADGAIGNINLDDSVLVARDQPMSINLDSTTTPHITLQATTNDAQFIRMLVNRTTPSPGPDPGIIIENNAADAQFKQSISLNLDGSMSMRSVNLLSPVTVEPEIFAAMLGIARATDSKCPIKVTYDLIDPANSSVSGTGYCFDHADTDLQTYRGAMSVCHGDGARLCSIGEIRQACQKNLLADNGPIMSADLAHDGANVRYLTLTRTAAGCANTTDYVIGSETQSTTRNYACCINP